MGLLGVNRNTVATAIAMMLVNSQALADSTDSTAITMVDILTIGIIKKLALLTEVLCELNVTGPAIARDGLIVVATFDAANLLSSMAIDFVVLVLIMATPAGKIFTTALCSNPAIAGIMLATLGGTLSWELAGVLG